MKFQYLLVTAGLVVAAIGVGAMQDPKAQGQTPAYIITEIDVTDAEAFAQYAPQVQPTFARFGGRYVARGGKTQSFIGEPPKRVVVLAFDSMERAQTWYFSPEYEALKALRDKSGKARIFAVEGLLP
jgi:uncharacterized protein (DUF1330 family)